MFPPTAGVQSSGGGIDRTSDGPATSVEAVVGAAVGLISVGEALKRLYVHFYAVVGAAVGLISVGP